MDPVPTQHMAGRGVLFLSVVKTAAGASLWERRRLSLLENEGAPLWIDYREKSGWL
jgi:hypothetical protein